MCALQEEERIKKDCKEAFAAAEEGQKGYLSTEALSSATNHPNTKFSLFGETTALSAL